METRVTGVHLRSARRSVLLECVQPQGILEIKFTAELPYASYLRLLRYTCSKNRLELINATNLDFEIAGPNTLVIRDHIDGCFSNLYAPKSCKAWIIQEYIQGKEGVWLTLYQVGSAKTFEYNISDNEYHRLKKIADIAHSIPLTEGITVRSIGIVGIGNVSHLFVTIDENSNIHFQNCVLVDKFEVSTELPN